MIHKGVLIPDFMLDFLKNPEALETNFKNMEILAMQSDVFPLHLNHLSDAFSFFKSLLPYAGNHEDDESDAKVKTLNTSKYTQHQLLEN